MFRTTNVDEIDSIKFIPNQLNRRIKNECIRMRAKYDEISVEYTIKCNIIVSISRKNNIYIFNIPNYYPFTAPRLKINSIEQDSFFDLKTEKYKKLLKYVSGLECLCCDSYLCNNNWNPSITFDKIINQIEEYKTFKYNISIKIILDKVKEKYLNRDIELDSWLFNIYDQNSYYR